MENLLFMWTGKIIWYAICGCTVLTFICAVFVVPTIVFHRWLSYLWRWVLAARLAKEGLTTEEVVEAYRRAGELPCKIEDFLDSVRRIQEYLAIKKKVSETEPEVWEDIPKDEMYIVHDINDNTELQEEAITGETTKDEDKYIA